MSAPAPITEPVRAQRPKRPQLTPYEFSDLDEAQSEELFLQGVRNPEDLLRSEQSVILELAAHKRPWLLKQLEDARSAVEELPTRARRALTPTPKTPGRTGVFGKLKRATKKKTTLLVLAPYAAAAVLGLFLVINRDAPKQPPAAEAVATETEASAKEAEPTHIAPAIVAPPPLAAADNSPAAQPAPTAEEPEAAPEPEPVAEAAPSTKSVFHTMAVPSALLTTPRSKGNRAALLEKGSRIVLYPEFPAPEGWLVAKKVDGGALGYVSQLHVEGKADAILDARISRGRKPKARSHRPDKSKSKTTRRSSYEDEDVYP